jgi:hypothetical protein
LDLDIFWCCPLLSLQDFFSDLISKEEFLRVAGGTNPSIRAKAIVEVFRTQNTLYVRLVTGLTVREKDVSSCFLSLKEHGVTIVKEEHIEFLYAFVDSCNLSAQRFFHLELELFWVIYHHSIGFLIGEPSRIVPPKIWVVEG